MYNNWRVRKYSKIAANRKAIRTEMQHSASVRHGRAKEIPFGIRALEQGVIVEGVWDSGANTPAPSMPGSPVLSGQRAPVSAAPNTSLDRPSTAHSTVTRIEITPPAERQQSALAPAQERRGRPTYRPRRASGLRFSNAAEEPEEVQNTSHPERGTQENDLSEEGRSVSWSRSSDEDRPTDDSSTRMEAFNSFSFEHLPPHPRYHDHSPAPSRTSQESNPFLTPTTRQSLDMPVQVPHIDDLVPLEGQGASSTYHSQLFSNADISYADGHAQPAKSFDADRSQGASQVVRKINSGFEILQPGTLGRPSMDGDAEEKDGDQREKRAPKKLQRKRRMSEIGAEKRQSKA